MRFYYYKYTQNTGVAAFSLVEMAVVLAIIGIVIGSGLTMSKQYIYSSKRADTAGKLDAIEKAIAEYVKQKGHLPCPAPIDAPVNNTEYQKPDNCSAATPSTSSGTINVRALPLDAATTADDVWIGTVPTRVLNLPDDGGLDAWNNRFRYAVLKNLASDKATFARYVPPSPQTFDVRNASNLSLLANSNNFLAYVLLSHGEDRNGATSKGSHTIAAAVTTCTAGRMDSNNCDHAATDTDAVFIDTGYNKGDIVASLYDDIIRWKTYKSVASYSNNGLVRPQSTTSQTRNITLFAGENSGCYKDSGNQLYCWGMDDAGSLGTNNGGDESVPRLINVLTTIRTMDKNIRESCAIDLSNKVWCWGQGGIYGMIGDGANVQRSVPTAVSGGEFAYAKDVSVGRYHVCAIDLSSRLWCWGSNQDNAGPGGNATKVNSPSNVTTSSTKTATPLLMQSHNALIGNLVELESGGDASCAINDKGELWCWGHTHNDYSGAFGSIPQTPYRMNEMPVKVTNVALSVYGYSGCALGIDEYVYCWGSQEYGRLGNGVDSTSYAKITRVNTISGITQIDMGKDHACALDKSRQLWCWGRNNYEQLGISGGTQTSPVKVTGLSNVTEFATGFNHSCARRQNQEIWCWGRNQNSALARSTASQNPAQINMP